MPLLGLACDTTARLKNGYTEELQAPREVFIILDGNVFRGVFHYRATNPHRER